MQQPPEALLSPVQKADERHLLDRLKRMGITAWHEPLLCLPKSFEDYSQIATLKQALPRTDVVSESKLFTLIVTEKPCVVSQPKKRVILNATDGMLGVKIVVFTPQGVGVQPWKSLEEGQRFHVRGVLQNWNGTLQMVSPTLVDPMQIGTVVPVYEKKRSVVAEGAIYDATRHALAHHFEDTIKNLIASFHGLSEADILRRARLKAPSIAVILKAAHSPSSEEEGLRGLAAMRRLAALSIVENAKQLKQRHPVPESIVKIPATLIQELVAKLPHPLTGDQNRTIKEIVDDMASPLPMRRVVSGDVGSGKTFTIMIPALAVQRLGLRAVVLTPNGLLADQFVKECKEYFGQDT
ncbi:MAG: DEAD/DEAH box helicase, partial [Dechloromonas sp.]